MKFEYEQAIVELCDELNATHEGLRVVPMRLTSRVTSVKLSGYVDNPDYTVLDYGNTAKPTLILKNFDTPVADLELHGEPLRFAYCEALNALVIDEKWLNARVKEIANE